MSHAPSHVQSIETTTMQHAPTTFFLKIDTSGSTMAEIFEGSLTFPLKQPV